MVEVKEETYFGRRWIITTTPDEWCVSKKKVYKPLGEEGKTVKYTKPISG